MDGVDLEVRQSERKRGCVFDHQRLVLIRHQGIQTHTLAFISPGSLLEVIGKVEVKWSWIKFDQTLLICVSVCVFVCECEAKLMLTMQTVHACTHTGTYRYPSTYICK